MAVHSEQEAGLGWEGDMAVVMQENQLSTMDENTAVLGTPPWKLPWLDGTQVEGYLRTSKCFLVLTDILLTQQNSRHLPWYCWSSFYFTEEKSSGLEGW